MYITQSCIVVHLPRTVSINTMMVDEINESDEREMMKEMRLRRKATIGDKSNTVENDITILVTIDR